MSQVEFTADTLKLDVLELARTGNKLLAVSGRPEWMCQAVEVADPVTFTTPDTVLVSEMVWQHLGYFVAEDFVLQESERVLHLQ